MGRQKGKSGAIEEITIKYGGRKRVDVGEGRPVSKGDRNKKEGDRERSLRWRGSERKTVEEKGEY